MARSLSDIYLLEISCKCILHILQNQIKSNLKKIRYIIRLKSCISQQVLHVDSKRQISMSLKRGHTTMITTSQLKSQKQTQVRIGVFAIFQRTVLWEVIRSQVLISPLKDVLKQHYVIRCVCFCLGWKIHRKATQLHKNTRPWLGCSKLG